MTLHTRTFVAALTLSVVAAAQDPKQDPKPTLEERVERLEQQQEAVVNDLQLLEFGDVIPDLKEGRYGLGPAASKVYGVEQGLSIGGYGEFLYQNREDNTDRFDVLRGIIYVGYKYSDEFVFNSEIEFEHGTTDNSSGTTSSSGSASIELAYLDWLASDEVNVRVGQLLAPMGFINELHEPTTFLGAMRPLSEQRIIPTTWREPGIGIFGDLGGVEYRAYAMASFDGERFGAGGLRGGRQKGNRSAAEDFAFVGRADYVDTPGLLVGASVFVGETGQDNIGQDPAGDPVSIPALLTTIFDVHAQYETSGWIFRGLYTGAFIDDTEEFNAATGNGLAEQLYGWYLEAGFDVLSELDPDGGRSLTPYVRYEEVNTQASLAGGAAKDRSRDEKVLTLGVNFKPIQQVVVKADYQNFDQGEDLVNVLFGYIF